MFLIQKYVLLHNVFSLYEAYNLALEAEEMVIWPSPFRRSNRSKEKAEQHQQSSIAEQLTKRDSSSIYIHATNN